MLEDVLRNRQHILICIQYEVLQKKSVDEAFQSFCKTLGNGVMEYLEFDYLFYQFLDGNFDLTSDSNKKPKQRGLADVPLDVAKKIVEKLEWEEKCIFRNVSKKCREVVDQKPIIIERIAVTDGATEQRLSFNDDYIVNEKLDERLEVEAFEKIAIKKLSIALHNPGLQVKRLAISFLDGAFGDKLVALIQSLTQQVHVKYFEYYDHKAWKYPEEPKFMKILPHLKPAILEEIELYDCSYTDGCFEDYLEKLAEFEQWNKSKELFTDHGVCDNIDKLAHFDRLSVRMKENIKPESVVRLKNLYLNSSTFEKCMLWSYDGEVSVNEFLEQLGSNEFPMADGGTLRVSTNINEELVFNRKGSF